MNRILLVNDAGEEWELYETSAGVLVAHDSCPSHGGFYTMYANRDAAEAAGWTVLEVAI